MIAWVSVDSPLGSIANDSQNNIQKLEKFQYNNNVLHPNMHLVQRYSEYLVEINKIFCMVMLFSAVQYTECACAIDCAANSCKLNY